MSLSDISKLFIYSQGRATLLQQCFKTHLQGYGPPLLERMTGGPRPFALALLAAPLTVSIATGLVAPMTFPLGHLFSAAQPSTKNGNNSPHDDLPLISSLQRTA